MKLLSILFFFVLTQSMIAQNTTNAICNQLIDQQRLIANYGKTETIRLDATILAHRSSDLRLEFTRDYFNSPTPAIRPTGTVEVLFGNQVVRRFNFTQTGPSIQAGLFGNSHKGKNISIRLTNTTKIISKKQSLLSFGLKVKVEGKQANLMPNFTTKELHTRTYGSVTYNTVELRPSCSGKLKIIIAKNSDAGGTVRITKVNGGQQVVSGPYTSSSGKKMNINLEANEALKIELIPTSSNAEFSAVVDAYAKQ